MNGRRKQDREETKRKRVERKSGKDESNGTNGERKWRKGYEWEGNGQAIRSRDRR